MANYRIIRDASRGFAVQKRRSEDAPWATLFDRHVSEADAEIAARQDAGVVEVVKDLGFLGANSAALLTHHQEKANG